MILHLGWIFTHTHVYIYIYSNIYMYLCVYTHMYATITRRRDDELEGVGETLEEFNGDQET